MLIPLVWLILTLIPLILLNRWLSRHIQGVGLLLTDNPNLAVVLYFLIMLPGIVVHELSHWTMARLLGMKTGKIRLGPTRAAGGKIRLGSVSVSKADPLRESLVGLAPLLAGVGLVLLIGALIFDLQVLGEAFILRDVGRFFHQLVRSIRTPDFWIWFYAIFTISNAMLPSESDRRAWIPLGIFLGVTTLVVVLVGWTPTIPPAWVDVVTGAIEYLITAFLLTLLVDLIFVGFIAGIETLLSLALGRRINY